MLRNRMKKTRPAFAKGKLDCTAAHMAVLFANGILFIACFSVGHLRFDILRAEGLQRTTSGEKRSHGNFVHHVSHYLNVGKIATYSVRKQRACASYCVNSDSCFSFNVAAHPDSDWNFLCEILSSDKYSQSAQLRPNPSFSHFSIDVSSIR